jgi:hypothetical protein
MKPKDIINKSYIILSKYSKSSGWKRVVPNVFKYKNAYKIEYIIADNDPFPFCSDVRNFTRQQWDNLTIIIHKELEEEIIDLEVLGLRGLFWKNDGKQLCLFQSHTILYGCWVKALDERKSFFVCEMVIGMIHDNYEKLADRIQMVQVAMRRFPLLYEPIDCRGCRKKLPSWVIECNRDECKMERFGRCKDESCYLPSESKDQEKCKKCGGEIEKIKF